MGKRGIGAGLGLVAAAQAVMLWLALALANSACAEVRPIAGAGTAGPRTAGEGSRAERVLTGDTIMLQDGRVIRLAGILAPRPTDRGARSAVEAAAEASRRALQEFVADAELSVRAAAPPDRHGRIASTVSTARGGDLALAMLRAGEARVFVGVGAPRLEALLAAEREARGAHRGLWARGPYAVRSDTEAGRYTDSFQIVEGRVLEVGQARGMVYLNFGRDYRRDFTIGLDRSAQRAFRAGGLDPATLAGKRIRVRGWLVWRNGPYIAARDATVVEVLDAGDGQ